MLGIVDEEVDVEVAEDGQLLTTLEQGLRPLELRIALLAAVLDLLQRALLRHFRTN